MGIFDYFERKRREEERKRLAEKAGAVITGAALGGLAGILFAPDSGEKTRKKIAEKSKDAALNVKSSVEDLADSVQYKAYQAGETSKKIFGDLKEKVGGNCNNGSNNNHRRLAQNNIVFSWSRSLNIFSSGPKKNAGNIGNNSRNCRKKSICNRRYHEKNTITFRWCNRNY